MKSLRWIIALLCLTACSALSFAQSGPADGQIGVKQSIKSTPITSLTQPITFSPCSGATGDILAECNTFSIIPADQPQEVFGGINETGMAWNSLSITLTGLNGTVDFSVGCLANTFFSISNCPVAIPAATDQSVTITFLQGTGTGIGCINTVTPTDPQNAACVVNSLVTEAGNAINHTNLPYDSYFPPFFPIQTNGPCSQTSPKGAVCGSDDFVIGIGLAGSPFVDPPTGGSLSANTPEPATFVMVGGAMLAMLLLGLRKTRLV
jgi:hypothetical protein